MSVNNKIQVRKLNLRGINKVMKSNGVTAALAKEGARMSAQAGDGYEFVVNTSHPWISRVYVQTDSYEAMVDNARNNTLLRVIT